MLWRPSRDLNPDEQFWRLSCGQLHQRAINLVGDTGFEPVNDGFKTRCLRPDLANPLLYLVEYPGIEPGVPLGAGDLQSPASPLMLLLRNLYHSPGWVEPNHIVHVMFSRVSNKAYCHHHHSSAFYSGYVCPVCFITN